MTAHAKEQWGKALTRVAHVVITTLLGIVVFFAKATVDKVDRVDAKVDKSLKNQAALLESEKADRRDIDRHTKLLDDLMSEDRQARRERERNNDRD